MAIEHHVVLVRWPEELNLREALRARHQARLLVVSIGERPPGDVDVLEDWVWSSADATEIEARMATLASRAQRSESVPRDATPTIDADGVLRVGNRWVALGPIESRIARVLTEHPGELVSREELEKVAWEGRRVRANTIDRQLHRLRAHLTTLGLLLVTVRGRGYILEAVEHLR